MRTDDSSYSYLLGVERTLSSPVSLERKIGGHKALRAGGGLPSGARLGILRCSSS
jgi:hypothetical protein